MDRSLAHGCPAAPCRMPLLPSASDRPLPTAHTASLPVTAGPVNAEPQQGHRTQTGRRRRGRSCGSSLWTPPLSGRTSGAGLAWKWRYAGWTCMGGPRWLGTRLSICQRRRALTRSAAGCGGRVAHSSSDYQPSSSARLRRRLAFTAACFVSRTNISPVACTQLTNPEQLVYGRPDARSLSRSNGRDRLTTVRERPCSHNTRDSQTGTKP